jgi:regulator of protease activity HflC (stomatin/prohibitin superfamily)
VGLIELLTQLLQLIRDVLWPFFIVSEPERGVRYTFGVPGVKWRLWRGSREPVLEPDWYFAVPWAQEIRLTNCAEDTIDVANLPITTKDGIQATVSYNIRLKVNDPLKYQTQLRQEIDNRKADTMPSAIHAECSTAVASMMRRRKWDQIYKSQGSIGNKITKVLADDLAAWGITVVSGGLTICSQAVPLALIHVD